MGKKVLLIGQGGREHALAWKITQSPELEVLYAAPGNPGMAELCECIDIEAHDVEKLLQFALAENIDLTIVGPEAPLMAGIVDRFCENGLTIFGPTADAARLEGSKVFTKNLFKKYGIPTAKYDIFSDIELAREHIKTYTDLGKPVVIKADGLAAGKGVVVAADYQEASQAIDSIMRDKEFGAAGDKVVIEECLFGQEVSFFAISDGKNFVPLVSAQDHKQVFDNDEGPNTGGMGAYCNPPIYTPELHQVVLDTIIAPVIEAMAAEGTPYQGVLYAGLMITEEGPKVLEFNARFGDPETQAVMPLIKSDILPLLEAAAQGRLENYQVEIETGTCICVVLASGGYPGSYEKGKKIQGIDQVDQDTLIFHAGTVKKDDGFYTSGGRVLAVVNRGENIKKAINKVYQEVHKIHFDNMHYRTDIGDKALI
ncbi:phosphoribosylamine--glycine ligase [hydrocarbon metagenome]|uniref:phosphoribosylamine--glycine ligase n=1 Tax=hydrocarbon metagenome TaxID=938273 RepID=A0A0W8E5C0_9ZZZZ